MAAGWSVMDALNKNSKAAAEEKPKARFRTRDISIRKIYSNDRNFYSMPGIEQLAQEILAVGLMENMTVAYAPCERGEYKIIAGERRWRALNLLLEKGYEDFETVTCQIKSAAEENEEMVLKKWTGKGKRKMQITTLPKDDVKRGEIYYISRGGYNTGSEQQADRPGVIVSNDKNNKNSQTLEVVYLTTQPKNELPTHCTIRSTGRVSTVLCEQIHTVAVERIGKYIGVCTAQEMQNIDIGLMISIGLGDAGGATKDKTVVTDQKEEKKAEEKKTEEKVQTETNEELIKTRTERDIFKKLYEQMTERLLERRE